MSVPPGEQSHSLGAAIAPAVDELAASISKNVTVLERTVSEDGITKNEIQIARETVIEDCWLLMNKVAGPTEMLKNMVMIASNSWDTSLLARVLTIDKDKHNLMTLQIINRYSIAMKVPESGQIPYEELALRCDLPKDILIRILRQAMTYGAFCEPQIGYIAHTDVSQAIPSLSPMLSYQLDICLPSTTGLVKSLQTGRHQTAFQIAHQTWNSWWEWAAKSTGWSEKYQKYQSLMTRGGGHDTSHVIEGYDWRSLGTGFVVDVGVSTDNRSWACILTCMLQIGGGDGFVAASLVEAFPLLTFDVQDRVFCQETERSRVPSKLSPQIKFTQQSFFLPQPDSSKEADVFLLRHILHDWPEKDCVDILQNLANVMKPNARLVIVEQVMEPAGKMSRYSERIMRGLDMQMMVQFGSQERTLDDWKALFAKADSRLVLVNSRKPRGSLDTLMEVASISN